MAQAVKSPKTRANKQPNDNNTRQKAKKALHKASRVVILIGFPFYVLFKYMFVGVLFVIYSVGYTVRTIFSIVFRLAKHVFNVTFSGLNIFQKKASRRYGKSKKASKKWLLNLKRSYSKRIKVFSKRKKTVRKSFVAFQKSKARKQSFLVKSLKLYILHLNLSIIKLFGLVPRPKRPKLPKIKLRYFFLLTALFFLLTIPSSFTYLVLSDIPSVDDLTNRNIESSTKIYDRNGTLLYKIYKDKNRTVIPFENIPPEVIYATLAAEDAEFYSHAGISPKGIARSIYKNLTEGKLSGGSTITQQLVKNALLTPEKTIVRKSREIILAFQVEQNFTKDEIMEMYLNEVSYGSTAYGIYEAAQYYFGKDVNHLNLHEAALLAGLPKSPTRFSPFGPTPNIGMARQKEVLALMRDNGYIDDEMLNSTLETNLEFAENRTEILAPHFVMYVKTKLEEKYGSAAVETRGYEVYTTLDLAIQAMAEKVVSEEIESLKSMNVGNAAVIVMDPKSGEVLAMVGSKDYFDIESDGNVNATVALRQPGSSIKIINYAHALSNGMTPATIINDSPITFTSQWSDPYSPKNYDGGFRGPLTLRSAFAQSRNVPAVKVLASYGVDKMIDLGKAMGITTWEDRGRFGLSLTLGGGEVKLIDLAQVYATVANYGARSDIKTVRSIRSNERLIENNVCDDEGIETPESPIKVALIKKVLASQANVSKLSKIITKPDCSVEQVIDPRVAFILTDILRDNNARSPAFGTNSQLVIPNHPEVAVKTGTSNSLRDNLTVGFNQDYLVAVWVGNNDGSPMSRVASGLTGASTIWNKIMSALISGNDSNSWIAPDGLVHTSICPGKTPEWFLDGTVPSKNCNQKTVGLPESGIAGVEL